VAEAGPDPDGQPDGWRVRSTPPPDRRARSVHCRLPRPAGVVVQRAADEAA